MLYYLLIFTYYTTMIKWQLYTTANHFSLSATCDASINVPMHVSLFSQYLVKVIYLLLQITLHCLSDG